MHVSDARRAANVANSSRSTGPTSERGKAISRRNSLKHGLTGSGVVVPEGDRAEVEGRAAALRDELQPRTLLGSMLLRKVAALSVRSERSAAREDAEVDERARNAAEAFDEARGDRADDLLDAIQDDPRRVLRKLRRMPEGVDRMIDAWRLLRHDLDRQTRNGWSGSHLGRASYLTGVRVEHAASTRIGDLSNAIWGDFYGLKSHEGADLDEDGRRDWARVELLGLVDAEIAGLEAHRATLDHDRIARDRLEAPLRSSFDDSREASLARRYEADSDRGFYKALKEYRQVEAEAEARAKATPGRSIEDLPGPGMGSFGEASPAGDRERSLAFLDEPEAENPVVRGSDGLPLSITRPLPPPG